MFSVKAGGKNVIFDETLEFNQEKYTSTLKIQVNHRDFVSGDDILGEHDVNLNLQNLEKEDAESEVTRKGRLVAADTL
jgi:hypothetical protein